MSIYHVPDSLASLVHGRPPEVAVVLGSGLRQIADRVKVLASLTFVECPPMASTKVDGHDGRILLGEWGQQPVLLFSGRNHLYEGHPRECVVAPVHLASKLGVKVLLLTNAAGGIRPDLEPGTLMVITNHLDCTRPGFWRRSTERNGPSPYSQRLSNLLVQAAHQLQVPLAQGTYASVLGPNYETPAEIRALRAMQADAVGMSTATEIATGHELGLECAAVACITNRAAGLSSSRLSHQEVLDMSQRQACRLGDLLEQFLQLHASQCSMM